MRSATSVHPHSRGVYLLALLIHHCSSRFIPTRVGYTLIEVKLTVFLSGSSPLAWGIRRKNPKTRTRKRFIPTRVGYTGTMTRTPRRQLGSSPLAWGILIQCRIHCQCHRFIPTRVGYTISFLKCSSMYSGSSPLAWGIRSPGRRQDLQGPGSSPLAWGILSGTAIMRNNVTVHPHSRGVYISGTSCRRSSCRFIPTRVGYTTNSANIPE